MTSDDTMRCPYCSGGGKYIRFVGGHYETRKCLPCNGTGRQCIHCLEGVGVSGTCECERVTSQDIARNRKP